MIFNRHKKYKTPGGVVYDLYIDMLKQPHLLIAGATGSGKSVVINGIMYTALHDSPARIKFILIDLKRVELSAYRYTPHCITYADSAPAAVKALNQALQIIETRYEKMQRQRVKKYTGAGVYIVIDEFADLMTTARRQIQPLIQRIAQIGRAAGVHLIVATQCPIREVIPTQIKCNFDSRVALRTRSQQDSRNILGFTGCELLPRYGQGYYMTPEGMTLYIIPMIPDHDLDYICNWWT